MTEGSKNPFLAKLLIAGSGIMSLANSMTVPFLAIFLRQELDLDPTTVGLVLGSSVFFSIFAGFLGGSLSDVLGRKRVLVFSIVGVLISFVGFFLTYHPLAAFAFNATLALCTNSFNPVAKALLGDLLPRDLRVKWFSYQYVTYNLGFVIGPPLGAALGLSGARSSFLVAALAYGVYALLLLGCRFPQKERETADESADGSADGSADRSADRSDRGLVRTTLRGLRDSAQVVLTDRRLLWFLVAAVLLETVHNRTSVLLAQHFDIEFSDGAVILAGVLTTNAITVVTFQLVAARYVQRWDPVRAITVGGVLTFVGMAGFAFSAEPWQYVVAMVIFSVGETFIVPSEFAVIDRIAPEERRGSYFGAHTFAQFGGFSGPYLGGLLLGAFSGTVMFLGIGSLAFVSVAIYLMVGRRVPGLMRTRSDADT